MAEAPTPVDAARRRRYRLLVVCTANQCRSPIAEHLWARHLRGLGIEAVLRSGGTAATDGEPATPMAIEALAPRGIDIGRHRAQRIGPWLGLADLIVTVTNQQVRECVAYDTLLWPRTFVLRDLVARAEVAPRLDGEGLRAWLDRIGESRRRIDLLGDGGPDDIEDPTGEPLGPHLAVAAELDKLLGHLTATAFGREDGLGRP